MKGKQPLGDPTGKVWKGRHEFHDHERDVIRAYLRMKLTSVHRAIKKLEDAKSKMGMTELDGQLKYWRNIASYFGQILASGIGAVDADDWREAWLYTAVRERHMGADKSTHPTIPGME